MSAELSRRKLLGMGVGLGAAAAVGGTVGGTVGTRAAGAAAGPTFLIGSAPDAQPGSSRIAKWQSANASYGPLTAHRTYSQPGEGTNGVPVSFAQTPAAADVGRCASLYSFHPKAGVDTTAAFRKLVDSIPAGHTVLLTPHHEVDGMIRRGQIDAASYRAIVRSYGPIVREARANGHPHVYLTACVGGYMWAPKTPRPDPESLWPGEGILDVITVDAYGKAGYPDAGEPSQYGGVYTYALDHDLPWGVFEIGAKEDPGDPQRKATWLRNHLDFVASHGSGGHNSAVVFSWFDSAGGGSTPTPSSSAACIQVAKTASTTYHRAYTDPGI